jgi:hypothetical protein
MRQLHLLLVLITALIGTVITSCSNADEPQQGSKPNVEGNTYEVSLGLAGEYTDISEEPFSRANEDSPKKYYGINVYCMKTDGTVAEYTKYAYGVFDNIADMKISLLGGYKYKFECTSVTEDADKFLGHEELLGCPFKINVNGSDNLEKSFRLSNLNTFIISQEENLIGIKNGTTDITNSKYPTFQYPYPKMDRFYGELENFEPANGATATIPLKRTAFGIKLIVNGVPDGSLSWRVVTPFFDFATSNCSGTDKYEISQIVTFENVYNCWKDEGTYHEDVTISFTWTRANGYEQSFEKTITVKRNVMTIINVNLKGGANDVSIGINEEENPMDNEEINIDCEGEDKNDTPVNP